MGLSFWQSLPMSIVEDMHNLVMSDECCVMSSEDPGGNNMRTPFFRIVPAMTLCLQMRLKQSAPLIHSPLPALLKPFSAFLRLCGLHSRCGFAAVFILFAAQPARLPAQNIPPMIGDHVGKPKLRIPNPLGSAQTVSRDKPMRVPYPIFSVVSTNGLRRNRFAQVVQETRV